MRKATVAGVSALIAETDGQTGAAAGATSLSEVPTDASAASSVVVGQQRGCRH
jgi:hypothetical protein